jgi:RNA polymerase sigma-70 factor (ECF subfamily)
VLNRQDYNHWLGAATRLSRKRDEAEDLLHDSLLAAVQARRSNLDDPGTRAWFAGLMRNKAAMTARSAGRRKRREAQILPEPAPQPALAEADEGTVRAIRDLSPSARIVAILALHGLTRPEIAAVLDISDESLRQRLTTLRKRWRALPQADRVMALESARRRRTLGDTLENGLIRRALIAFLHELPGIGTHDPDGHLIVFGVPSQIAGRRQRTDGKE